MVPVGRLAHFALLLRQNNKNRVKGLQAILPKWRFSSIMPTFVCHIVVTIRATEPRVTMDRGSYSGCDNDVSRYPGAHRQASPGRR